MSLHDGAGCINDPAGNILGNASPTAQHIASTCRDFETILNLTLTVGYLMDLCCGCFIKCVEILLQINHILKQTIFPNVISCM